MNTEILNCKRCRAYKIYIFPSTFRHVLRRHRDIITILNADNRAIVLTVIFFKKSYLFGGAWTGIIVPVSSHPITWCEFPPIQMLFCHRETMTEEFLNGSLQNDCMKSQVKNIAHWTRKDQQYGVSVCTAGRHNLATLPGVLQRSIR